MDAEQIKKKTLGYHWEPWLKRPFYGFIISTFAHGNSKKAFQKIGFPDWEYQSFLFSNGDWFQAEEVYQKTKKPVLTWLKKHSVSEINDRLEASHSRWKKIVSEWAKNPKSDTLKKFEKLDEILREITTYVWATHALEHFFAPLLRKRTQIYVTKNLDKFVGDASFPERLNASAQMVKEFKQGKKIKMLAKEFGWMRARDGFARPYAEAEIFQIVEHSVKQAPHIRPQIPQQLKKFYQDARELVYLRMFRMDAYFELMYLAKPLLKAVARKYRIPFARLKFYTTDSLLAGKPKAYPPGFAGFSYGDKMFYFDGPIFLQKSEEKNMELRGSAAQRGVVVGKAKIVMHVGELNKVKKGDVLITYMTSPNFLPAMKLASAFVTNEGGLTCHAAIVAREMKKPCVIGTKIATKVFKDEDLVEVDANKGIVKKLK